MLFSNEEINNISNYKYQIRLKAKEIYDKYMSDELITEEEITMFEFFTSKIGTNHQGIYQCQKQLISKLLNSNKDFHISGKIFYAKFITNEKCRKLNLPVAQIYIGNKDFWNNSQLQNNGCSYGDTGLITITENFIRKNPNQKYDMSYQKVGSVSQLVKITQTVHHELEHYKQSCYTIGKKINLSSYYNIKSNILRKYLSSNEFDEYKKNCLFSIKVLL